MENQSVLGPRPSAVRDARNLSRPRRELLMLLQEQPEPVTLSRLAELSGLHENTVRGHLDGLAEDELVVRDRAEPTGRGRPAWLWRACVRRNPEYAGLAGALARTLKQTSKRPADDAIEAGRNWGHQLAGEHPSSAGSSPCRKVVDLLEDLGFAPEQTPGPGGHESDMRLTRCPLLEVAREEPTIVCNVHLGLVGGALEGYAAEDPDADLVPFAEPGACLLHISDRAG